METPEQDLLNTEQLAAELQISTQTLLKWNATGKVPSIRVGRVIRYSRRAVLAALQGEHAEAAAT